MRDGEPCSHKGCLNHISHPCEGCGRVGGIENKKLSWDLTVEFMKLNYTLEQAIELAKASEWKI